MFQVSNAVDAAQVSLTRLHSKPGGLRTRPNTQVTSYSGDAEAILRFVMQGGPALSYGDCYSIFNQFVNHLSLQGDRRHYPCQGAISKNGQVKLEYSIKKIPVTPIVVENGYWQLYASIYPTRRIPPTVIRATIDRVKEWASHYNQGSWIPQTTVVQFRFRGAYIDVDFNPTVPNWTHITYGQFSSLLDAFKQYLQSHYICTVIVGGILTTTYGHVELTAALFSITNSQYGDVEDSFSLNKNNSTAEPYV